MWQGSMGEQLYYWMLLLGINIFEINKKKNKKNPESIASGSISCLLLGISSGYAQPITGQVPEVTSPLIGWAQLELTPSKKQKMGPGLLFLPPWYRNRNAPHMKFHLILHAVYSMLLFPKRTRGVFMTIHATQCNVYIWESILHLHQT